jgi:hypothetical protein
MDTPQYIAVANDAMNKLEELQRQRDAIDAEALKLEQLVIATANMLRDEPKTLVLRRLAIVNALTQLREGGLTDAIRVILQAARGEWLTVTTVRDRLESAGFDFSTYTTNPLASISTTLRRMKAEDVDTKTTNEGVTAYRWKQQPSQLEKALAVKSAIANKKSHDAFYGGGSSQLAEALISINESSKKK